MKTAEKSTSWVVYLRTIHQKDAVNAICNQNEWDEMELHRPGYHTLIKAGITSETEAEKLARGTSGDAKVRLSQNGATAQVVLH